MKAEWVECASCGRRRLRRPLPGFRPGQCKICQILASMAKHAEAIQALAGKLRRRRERGL